uniref:Canopy FGF signaling regulator 4 n=1 Tax=Cyprinus carpio TaxID=7962 RepID=A0A8C2EFE8_CYPCA
MEIFAIFFICMFRLVLANQEERLPNKCEVCKLLMVELQDVLEKTGRPKEVLELGQLSLKVRKKSKSTEETRLTEAMDNISKVLSSPYQNMNTQKNLMDKGAKVELGIPYELWDEPSVEVADLKRQCESMLEENEEFLENWYFHHQDESLDRFFCATHFLRDSDQGRNTLCVWKGNKGVKRSKEESEGENGRQTHDAGEL